MKRKRPPKQKQRGVALIMVLILIAILSAIAADMQNESSVNLKAAVNARDQLQAYFHARSALELELFMLSFQSQIKGMVGNILPVPIFSLSPMIVSSDTMKGILDRKGPKPTDTKKKASYASNKPFGDFEGSFWIEDVVDENRKININRESASTFNAMQILLAGLIDDPRYDPLFENVGATRDPLRARLDIIANITDWVDRNDNIDSLYSLTQDSSQSGASEDTRYDRLPYGAIYKPKNGKMRSLAEVRLVPGVNDAFMTLFAPNLTIWTDDNGVNLNTANRSMLQGILRAIVLNPTDPANISKYQIFMDAWDIAHVTAAEVPEKMFLDLLTTAALPLNQTRYQELKSQQVLRFTNNSNVFRISAMGRVNQATSSLTVVWRDNPLPRGEIFYFREE